MACGSAAQVDAGLGLLALLLAGFGEVIRSTCAQEAGRGVDLMFEQRRQRCEAAKLALQGLGMKLGVLARKGGAEGERARVLAAQLQEL